MSALLVEIISLLTAGITQIATGIGAGLQALVTSIFVEVDATTGALSLSHYGGIIIVFAGIGLAIGLCTRILRKLESLGN